MANDLAGSSKVAAARAAADVDDHNRIQFGRQVKAVVGIDLAGSAKLKPIIAGFIRDNVARITGLSDRLAADVERMVAEALAGGRIHESLADDLQARLGVTESRAALIAVDQVGKLNGQLNAQRQQDLGVTHFYWRTSEDERVRGNPGGKYPRANPSHWARRNLRFAYADPPKGKNGEPELPGTPIRCRCNAEPDLEDLRAREEAGAADPDSTLLPPLDPDVEADARAQLAGLEPTEMAPPPVFDPASVQRLLAAARAVSIADAPARAADTFTPLLRLVPPPPATPPVTPTMLGGLLTRIADGTISGKIAKDVFEIVWTEGGDPAAFLREQETRINHIVFDSVRRHGGSISAEHGIGSLKAETLPQYKHPVALALMRRIKAALDPQGIMNPGRVLAEPKPKQENP